MIIMKKTNWALMLSMGLFLVLFAGCSSDNDTPVGAEDQLALEGVWQLETMNFLNKAQVEWDSEVPFTPLNWFGYAPEMFKSGKISGFIFAQNEVVIDEKVVGNRFDYIMNGFEPPEFDANKTYWYWNYTHEQKSFEVQQLDGPMPPHDYTLYNIRAIEISNGGQHIVFKADLTSRKVGADRGDNLQTEVEFTITKGTPNKFVDVLIDGETYVSPEE